MKHYNESKGENITSPFISCEYESISLEDIYNSLIYLGQNESELLVNEYGYKTWNDFLSKNNYLDKYGNPNIEVFKLKMYKKLNH